jgi:spermidine synthase
MYFFSQRIIFLCLVFVTGGVVLSLEVIASRIMTPFFGVSLYIWTAILSVTLTFLALGYQLGGWLTKKINIKEQEEIFIYIPLLSALFIFISCLLYPFLLPRLPESGLIFGSFIGSLILLAFPLIFLSSLNPILISFLRSPTENNDSGAGLVFFVSTVGSVVGVFVTALLLVPKITNFSSMIINGIILVSFSLIIHFATKSDRSGRKNKKILVGSIILFALCFSLLFWKHAYLEIVTLDTNKRGVRYEILEEYPSHYGDLKIIKLSHNGKEQLSYYALLQDGLVQNRISKTGESLSTYSYVLQKLIGLAPHAKSALVLGFGAGVVPRKLREKGIDVSVVEINPDTLKAAKKFFHYETKGTKIFFEDARTFVKKCTNKYDIILIDLFQGDGMPEHITTKEFYQDIKKCMTNKGLLVTNNFISQKNISARMHFLATIYSVFGNAYFYQNKKSTYNAFTVATKSFPLTTHFNLDDIPTTMKKRVKSTLKSQQEYHLNIFSQYKIFRDGSNTFSSLFAKQSMEYRKGLTSYIPSRILIN